MSTINEALKELREEVEGDLNHLLPKELQPYFNLYSLEKDPELDHSDVEELEQIKDLEYQAETKVIGILWVKPGYEDDSYEVDGDYYCEDGNAYFGISEYNGHCWRWFAKAPEAMLEAIGVEVE